MTHRKLPEVAIRMDRIKGHAKGIRKMIDEGKSYSDILHQITVVRAALDRVVGVIVEGLIEHIAKSSDTKRKRQWNLRILFTNLSENLRYFVMLNFVPLVIGAGTVGIVHMAAPDHWVTLSVLGRSVKGTRSKVFKISVISSVGNVALSLALGIAV